MNRSADLVFSYGKSGCLGKPVAFMELNKGSHRGQTFFMQLFPSGIVEG